MKTMCWSTGVGRPTKNRKPGPSLASSTSLMAVPYARCLVSCCRLSCIHAVLIRSVLSGSCWYKLSGPVTQSAKVAGNDRPVLRLHTQRMARAAVLQ